MSEENTETTTETAAEKKAREPKKNSIPAEKVSELIEGIPQYDKTSFLVVGHKNGVRVALPKTNGVSRAYFYGNGDYAIVPSHPAVTTFTEEQRKERRLGGIMAEVNFEKGIEVATEGLAALVAVVRAAEAPAPKGVKAPKEPKTPRKKKAADETTVDTSAETETDDTPAES